MIEKPYISRIRIYPVKALDPVEVTEAVIGTHSLENDRAFAMLATDGKFINGKRTGRVNQLHATYDLPNQLIYLTPRAGGNTNVFELKEGNAALNDFLENFFETKLSVRYATQGEFMDIPETSSLTVLSEASLQSLQDELHNHTLEDLRLRFRANIEIGGVDAFWEEQLFKSPGTGIRFTAGAVEMIGVSPRARCNVPPRDPFSGILDKSFVKKMMKSRSNSLADDSYLPQYGNMYHLTVNTYIPKTEKGKMIRLGDAITIIEPVKWEA